MLEAKLSANSTPTTPQEKAHAAREQAAWEWLWGYGNDGREHYYYGFWVNAVRHVAQTKEFTSHHEASDKGNLTSLQAWQQFAGALTQAFPEYPAYDDVMALWREANRNTLDHNVAWANFQRIFTKKHPGKSPAVALFQLWPATVVKTHVLTEDSKGSANMPNLTKIGGYVGTAKQLGQEIFAISKTALLVALEGKLEHTDQLAALLKQHYQAYAQANYNKGVLWVARTARQLKKLKTQSKRLALISELNNYSPTATEPAKFVTTVDYLLTTSLATSMAIQAKQDGRLADFLATIRAVDIQIDPKQFEGATSENGPVKIEIKSAPPKPNPTITIQYRYPPIIRYRQAFLGGVFLGCGITLINQLVGNLALSQTAMMVLVPLTLIAFGILNFTFRHPLPLALVTYQPPNHHPIASSQSERGNPLPAAADKHAVPGSTPAPEPDKISSTQP